MIHQEAATNFHGERFILDHDYTDEEALLGENTDLTRAIHQLTLEVHQHLFGEATTLASD